MKNGAYTMSHARHVFAMHVFTMQVFTVQVFTVHVLASRLSARGP